MGTTPLLIYKANNGQIFLQPGYPSTAIISNLLSNLAQSALQQYSR